MAETVSATEARVHFGEIMERVAGKEETIVVARGGRPRIVMLSIRAYDRLTTAAEGREGDWLAAADQARRQILAELGSRQLPPPEEFLDQIREERDEQLLRMH